MLPEPIGQGRRIAESEQRGIAVALAQRRQGDDGDGERVEQVLAESVGADLSGQAAVGGGTGEGAFLMTEQLALFPSHLIVIRP